MTHRFCELGTILLKSPFQMKMGLDVPYLQRDVVDVAGVDARDLDVGTHQVGRCQLELNAVQSRQPIWERDG